MHELGPLITQLFDSGWGNAVVWFGGMWAVMLFIRKVSKDADDELDPEKRQLIGRSLIDNETLASGSWIPDFTLVFDRFFGKHHYRWRCIYRSGLISVVSFMMLCVFINGIDLAHLFPSLSNATWGEGNQWFHALALISMFAVIANAPLDYLSLLETRYLLKVTLPLSTKLLVDALLTFALSYVWQVFVVWLAATDGYEFWFLFSNYWLYLLADFVPGDTGVVRIIFATSFTTSIWLWLHGLSQLTIRTLGTTTSLLRWLNVKEKPLRAIGTMINFHVLLIGVVLFPFFVIFN